MEKSIQGAQKIINDKINKKLDTNEITFDGYQKFYSFTNENIANYLNFLEFNEKNNALTALASGDHAFNLITKGILSVDTFDMNRLTEYYALGLKRAAILKYDYYGFINIFNKLLSDKTTSLEISEIIIDLLQYMDERHKKFWKEIIDYMFFLYNKWDINFNYLRALTLGGLFTKDFKRMNNYLLSESDYNILRANLAKANISFKYSDAYDLDKNFNSQYNVIILSNILDYFTDHFGKKWQYDKLKEYEEKLRPLTKKGATVFLHYIYFYGNQALPKTELFHSSNVHIENLDDEEVLSFNRYLYFNAPEDPKDAIILKRY